MKRPGRWLAGFLLLLVLLLSVLTALFRFSSQESRREMLLAAASFVPGLELRLGREFSWQMSRQAAFELHDIRLVFSGERGQWRLQGRRLDFSFPLLPLLAGRFRPNVKGEGLLLSIESRGQSENLSWPADLLRIPGQIQIRDMGVRFKDNGRIWHLQVDRLAGVERKGRWQLDLQGRFNGQVLRLRGEQGVLSGLELEGRLGELELSLNRVDDGLRLELRGADLCSLGKPLAWKLPCLKPARVDFHLRYGGTGVDLEDIRLVVGKSRIEGALHMDVPDAGRPFVVKGKLRADMLDLGSLLPADQTAPRVLRHARDAADLDPLRGQRLFSVHPWPLEWVRQLEMDLDLEVQRVRGMMVVVTGLRVPVSLKGGRLRIGEFSGRSGEGSLRGMLVFDASAAKPRWVFTLEGRDLVPVRGGDTRMGEKGQIHPRLHLEARLDARGDSLAAMMGAMNGEVLLDLRNYPVGAGIPESVVQRLLQALDQRKTDERGLLQCGAAYFSIREGKATTPRGMAAVFGQATWMGQGNLDLKTEKISLEFRPLYRKGLGLRLKGMAGLVMLGGTLSRPTILIDPKGAVRNSLSVAAAVSTGGASLLLEGLLEKNRANSDVCGEILRP
ncbi:hypothetical protein [Thiolapillus sp.]